MDIKVSIVMPALNEEKNIVQAVRNAAEGINRSQQEGEIIVVNDGSTDGTASLLKTLQTQFSFLRVLTHAAPQGIGASFWDGVQHANGEIVTLLPGDGENDANEVLQYLPLLNSVDIVVPFVFNRETRSPMRRLLSTAYRSVINFSFGLSLNYFNGTVLYRRCILKKIKLRSTGFFYQAELLIKCISAGYLYSEVPYGLNAREAGESKAVSLKSLKYIVVEFSRFFLSAHFSKTKSEPFSPSSVTAKRRAQFPAPDVDTGLLFPAHVNCETH